MTPAVLATGAYGIYKAVEKRTKRVNSIRPIHILLIGHIVIYLIFFSLGSRRVDRWLLPLIPIFAVYSAYGISLLRTKIAPTKSFGTSGTSWVLFLGTVFATLYLCLPVLLLTQFQRHTPKTEAYLWAQENLEPWANKYVVTEEGLDPMNKLPSTTVKHFEVYSTEGAQFYVPPETIGYHYIIFFI